MRNNSKAVGSSQDSTEGQKREVVIRRKQEIIYAWPEFREFTTRDTITKLRELLKYNTATEYSKEILKGSLKKWNYFLTWCDYSF